MGTAVLERQVSGRCQRSGDLRDQDLIGACSGHHASSLVHREATDIAARGLDLAGPGVVSKGRTSPRARRPAGRTDDGLCERDSQ